MEIQALVAPSRPDRPRRVAYQVSSQRLSLLLAVLESRCGVDTSALDVFAATAGGLSANEPGVDVALALGDRVGDARVRRAAAASWPHWRGRTRRRAAFGVRVDATGPRGAAPRRHGRDCARARASSRTSAGVTLRRCRSLAEAIAGRLSPRHDLAKIW